MYNLLREQLALLENELEALFYESGMFAKYNNEVTIALHCKEPLKAWSLIRDIRNIRLVVAEIDGLPF